SSDWMGWQTRQYFQESGEMLKYLESIPVGIVVIDAAGWQTPHGRLLLAGIQSHPERWELLSQTGTVNSTSHNRDILTYRLIGHENKSVGKILIPMRIGGVGDISN